MEPQYAEISSIAISTGKLGDQQVLSLRVWSSGAQHEFLLGDVEHGEDIAREFNKSILAATRKGRRDKTGLVVVTGGNDAALKRPQGRKPPRSQYPGKEGA